MFKTVPSFTFPIPEIGLPQNRCRFLVRPTCVAGVGMSKGDEFASYIYIYIYIYICMYVLYIYIYIYTPTYSMCYIYIYREREI